VRVNQQVTGTLDVNDPVKGPYTLEISSPGFDRPLFTLEQFSRFTGHRARLQLHDKVDGRRNLTGQIAAVTEDSVDIEAEGAHYLILADNIERARLAPEWAGGLTGMAKSTN
jgi:Uncharacterized protein conserved in bacteria